MNNTGITDVLIIGAGISGLLCATQLQQAGRSVQLLDKGRGVGGRMSTRRTEGGRFDHGAQYFTCRSNEFQHYIDAWLKAGVIREWFRYLPSDTNPDGYSRYCGFSGMNAIPKYLAKTLQVHVSEQACRLKYEEGHWIVETMAGHSFAGRELVITAPLPQVMALLDSGKINLAENDDRALRNIKYDKGLALMGILDGSSGLPSPGGIKVESAVLSWVADNQMKGISPDLPTITLHATPEFAEQHWASDDQVRGELMLKVAGDYLQSEIQQYSCHRWAFTTATNPWPQRFYRDRDKRLTLAGDSFGEPRVEGAARSGLAAAQAILNRK